MLAPDFDSLRSALSTELLTAFPAAFLGRVTLVPYRPLGSDSLARIVRLHLDRVVRRMADNNRIALSYAAEVVDYIVGRCFVKETGARLLIGFIEQHVLPRLARQWLDAFAAKSALTHMTIEVTDPAAASVEALVVRSAKKMPKETFAKHPCSRAKALVFDIIFTYACSMPRGMIATPPEIVNQTESLKIARVTRSG
ncbi:ATP-dependent Clp protease ATP-binding subunit ClpA [Paraburkholderia sp. WSM4177]|nr:ATP-dependent Clp protease ATP-binding subunit ClpA [Paraburkholderia sp. WSM4177]MBB5483797.1 ATP-dependent Clp protease ATP-binding subunit ClpA [Paraburkholderia sp. WSM4180]